jgi:hypothetical protein
LNKNNFNLKAIDSAKNNNKNNNNKKTNKNKKTTKNKTNKY